MGKLLSGVNSPSDLKCLSLGQLEELSGEIREAIVGYVGSVGGHLASNLGVVELTVALHSVFDAPRDQIVFDVSHQCYTHKMLTGRQASFTDATHRGKVSGFTNPEESIYDLFAVGHASTAVSLATGLAYARDLRDEDYSVVAVVGDGALSGGESFEGLNNASELKSGIVIVINDNECSIAANVGGVYSNLAELRATNGMNEHNLFREMGFDYHYVAHGHDVGALVDAFTRVRHAHRPTVVHVHTVKGKGIPWAETHPEEAHELRRNAMPIGDEVNGALASHLLDLALTDRRVVIVSPATPLSHGFDHDMRERLGNQFVDVGIAEEHAVTFAAALARGGARPVLCVTSTFLQRAYDQLVEDVALGGLPVTILCYKAGLSERDATHVGSLDIAFTSMIPNLTCFAPCSVAECRDMVDWAVGEATVPTVIRIPRGHAPECAHVSFLASDVGRWRVTQRGSRVAFVVLGDVGIDAAQRALPLLKERAGIDASVVNAMTYSTIDEDLVRELARDHDLLVVVEDGVVDGGLGQRVAAFCCNAATRVLVRGGAKEFTRRVSLAAQYERYRLVDRLLVEDVLAELGRMGHERSGDGRMAGVRSHGFA